MIIGQRPNSCENYQACVKQHGSHSNKKHFIFSCVYSHEALRGWRPQGCGERPAAAAISPRRSKGPGWKQLRPAYPTHEHGSQSNHFLNVFSFCVMLPADKDAARVDELDLPAKDRSPLSHTQSGLGLP